MENAEIFITVQGRKLTGEILALALVGPLVGVTVAIEDLELYFLGNLW